MYEIKKSTIKGKGVYTNLILHSEVMTQNANDSRIETTSNFILHFCSMYDCIKLWNPEIESNCNRSRNLYFFWR